MYVSILSVNLAFIAQVVHSLRLDGVMYQLSKYFYIYLFIQLSSNAIVLLLINKSIA